MTGRLGCPRGCPLDHHEPPCPRAFPSPWDGPNPAEADRAYDDGYRAAARRFYALGVAAGINAASMRAGEAPHDLIPEPPEGGQ